MAAVTMMEPVAPDERIEAMDVLRGIALLGILLMNIEAMAGPIGPAMTGLDPALTGLDRWADAAVYTLVQGKFYTLFSLLFGMGFAVMMRRCEAGGRAFSGVYLRRSLALLTIGAVHMLGIWSGDILMVYATLSLLLLWGFRHRPTSTLPRWGVALFLIPAAMMFLLGAVSGLAALDPAAAGDLARAQAQQAAAFAEDVERHRAAYGGSDYGAAVAQRLRDFKSIIVPALLFGWQVLGMFVLGLWFVRSGAMERPHDFRPLYTRLRWIALPAGLALMLISFALDPTFTGRMDLRAGGAVALAWSANLLMCLGYFAWAMHALQSPAWHARLSLFAPAGRMALTNYLAQSVIGTLVFYGYGLGWFEQMPRAWQIPFAIALFTVQVAWSRAWLARYRHGPAEWVWRALTYGRRPPMRLATATGK